MANGVGLSVDSDMPGGNVRVEKLEGAKLLARPDLRDTEGDWFYWHFRLRGAAGKDFSCEFSGPPPIAGAGPAASFDGGETYAWLGPESVREWRRFSCRIPPGTGDARFCVTHPYTGRNLERWLAKPSVRGEALRQILCASRQGRPVELLRLGHARREPVCRVLLAARHHACEAMASYALEGMLDAMLEGDMARAFYRPSVEVLALPFADRDGVEDGDQGKSRRPRDHGRDYAGESIYPETGALRAFAPDWFGQRLCAAIDLHCPWIRGEWNEHIYQVGLADPKMWDAQQRFGAILENVRAGPLPYSASRDLPFGTDWNNEENEGDGESLSSWAARQPGVVLSTSLEIPYAVVSDRFIDPAAARLFGHDLAKALAEFLAGR